MNDLPAVAAETKNTTTVTILHVIVAKNGLYVLGLPRDSPLLAVTDERRVRGKNRLLFRLVKCNFSMKFLTSSLSLLLFSMPSWRRVRWKLELGSVARKEGESEE